MADAGVLLVIERLGDLLIAEAKFLYGVRDKVEHAKEYLKGMLAFLKDADASVGKGDERDRLWVVQIRDSAHSLENVIETFILEVDSRRRSRGLKNVLRRYACMLNEVSELRRVGSEIDKISTSLYSLASNRQTYGKGESRGNEDANSSQQQRRELRRTYSHTIEQDVVGLDEDIEKLVVELTKENNSHRVVSICGMGGLGKTTLARKIYHHPQVRIHFDCFAWVSISQQCEVRAVWEEILIKLTSAANDKLEEIKRMTPDGAVAKEIYNVQKSRKCLVLLDDIWTTSAWDRLKAAFPEDETDHSKILLTSRQQNVALHGDKDGLIHQLQCLDADKSWELFEKKTNFGKRMTSLKDNEKMKKLGQEMLKHCAGLPLAIILLSGLVSTKDTIVEWGRLHENVEAYINKGKGHDEQEYKGVSSILSLSYDELPYQLKPCFLHLAHSPEDQEIMVKRLCLTWIAEGFMSLGQQQTQSSTVTVEDAAYQCLCELVERNMIQVGTLGSTGRIKSCRIHDLMLDLSLSKAQEENFLQFIDLRNRSWVAKDSLSSTAETNIGRRNKVRRLAIYTNGNLSDFLPFIDDEDGYVRSLVFVSRDSNPSKNILKTFFNHFKLLRVLRLEKYNVWGLRDNYVQLPKEIGKLIHLRLLSLHYFRVEKIPSSIGNLRCLETLDLRVDVKDKKVPNVIWRLEQLRHLYLPFELDVVSGVHLRLPNVSNLQTLYNVKIKHVEKNDFLQLTNLKKLLADLGNDLGGSNYYSCSGVTFDCLQSLTLLSKKEDAARDIIPVISCYPCIYKLAVWMPIIKLPEEHQFPPNLVKLWLLFTRLVDDPMKTLEKLSNLRVLSFDYNSFTGDEMECTKGGFPRLESLKFSNLKNLREWRIEEGALPCLRHLKIRVCESLDRLPDGLRFLTTLKQVQIEWMSLEFKTRIEQGGDDFYKVQHVPSLVFLNTIQESTFFSDSVDEDGDGACSQ